MDSIRLWVESNIELSILISAIVGPLLVGSILDLWLRPWVEARKTKKVLINDLNEEASALFSTILAGLLFVYGYDKFIKGDRGIKSRSRVLTLKLENEYENVKQLSTIISRLGVHYNFDDEFIKSTTTILAVAAGNIMRIRDTVEEGNYVLFNGINKTTINRHIREIRELRDEVETRKGKTYRLKRFLRISKDNHAK